MNEEDWMCTYNIYCEKKLQKINKLSDELLMKFS